MYDSKSDYHNHLDVGNRLKMRQTATAPLLGFLIFSIAEFPPLFSSFPCMKITENERNLSEDNVSGIVNNPWDINST